METQFVFNYKDFPMSYKFPKADDILPDNPFKNYSIGELREIYMQVLYFDRFQEFFDYSKYNGDDKLNLEVLCKSVFAEYSEYSYNVARGALLEAIAVKTFLT